MKFSHLILSLTLALTSAVAFASDYLTILVKDGPVVIKLFPEVAPQNVARIKALATSGKYNDVAFHRVIDGFMIQGGGMDAQMREKATDKAIVNEARNGLQNTVGTIAMARTAAPNSATSQFFINTANNTPLNYKGPTPAGAGYAVFGRVTGGMNVVNAISKTRTTSKGMHQDVPATPIVIKKVTVYKTK